MPLGTPCTAGLVLQMEGQPFNTNGWGGVPASLSLCVEKDKQTFCLQGETHLSLVHSVPPFGKRHITHVCGSWEMLRPNIKDVMYQLEVNTFKDGLLAANDHAGCGAMLARCAPLLLGPLGHLYGMGASQTLPHARLPKGVLGFVGGQLHHYPS